MNVIYKIIGVTLALSSGAVLSIESSHDIAYPVGWKNWATIAVSHRIDNHTLRSILGNNIAVKAARAGKTNPWPEGSIIGKVVWKETELNDWKSAIVPNKFVHAEFMFKDAKKYASSSGWGWARWVGLDQKPFQQGMQVCTTCHAVVKQHDWVFTAPALLP